MNKAPARVWDVLTTAEGMKRTFFGADIMTDSKVGSPIIYRGIWEVRMFEDKGQVVEWSAPHHLAATHWSPLAGP